MDLDGLMTPQSSRSASTNVDDDAASDTQHPSHAPTLTPSGPDPSFAGPNDPYSSSRLSSSASHPGPTADNLHNDHGLVPWQLRDRLPTSQPPIIEGPEAESRKRKIIRLSPHASHADTAESSSSRRTRPRLMSPRNAEFTPLLIMSPPIAADPTHSSTDAAPEPSSSSLQTRPRLLSPREAEFTPLLIMSPGREYDFLQEETLTAFHYTPVVADPPQRHPPLRGLGFHEARILPTTSAVEVRPGLERSDSTSSFEQVALATVATRSATPASSTLSTLSSFSLPCPFENTNATPELLSPERSPTIAGPLFPIPPSLRSPRSVAAVNLYSHLQALRGPGSSSGGPSPNRLFGEPFCDSPESFRQGLPLGPPRIDPENVRRVISAPIGCAPRSPAVFRSLPAK